MTDGATPLLYQVTVVDPQLIGEGRKAYTSYGVDVAMNGKHASTTIIRRRYSDFQWLATRLQVERPGAIIPWFPHKRAITQEARFNEALIKERRAALQTFIQDVVAHPEIVSQQGAGQGGDGHIPPSLKAFFTYESPETLEEAKKDLEKANPNPFPDSDKDGSGSGDEMSDPPTDMTGRLRNLLARSVVTASLLSGQLDVLETTEHEHEIESMTQYVEGTATFVRELSTTCAALVKSTVDRANSLDTFADAIFGWCLAHRERFCPNTTNPTVEAFRKVNEFTKYVSKAEQKKADQEREQLEHSLQDLQRRVQAIQRALASRKEYQVRYTARVQQVNSRKNALAKLQTNATSGGSPRLDKIAQAQVELATAQSHADKAKQTLLLVSERLIREMNRVQGGLDAQLRNAIADYSRIQSQHMQLMLDGWTKFIPHVAVAAAAGTNHSSTMMTMTTTTSNASSGMSVSSSSSSAPPPASAFPPTPPNTAANNTPTSSVSVEADTELVLHEEEEENNRNENDDNNNKNTDEPKAQVIVGV